ncbi:28S rRNA (cytosine-C(5))-methyltransferase isoform X3-like [Oopsacas minuta]|uniref:28S rRNA (Cytosine-C(5))-methyltransferase isoform X3-like n=1 Tax=Oopsacas minuta TaxID=111878 RepID=A0AAV7JTK0_9METZ|nr:28S rRNA (cytosine-C(5))-methyltransferase isoform X3-like [Oopsacas minuta]
MAFEYKIGGEILRKFIEKEGSLESLIFKSKFRNLKEKPLSLKKRIFALVINTLKNYELIEKLIKYAKMDEILSIPIPHYSLVLMTYDLLFRKAISGGGQWKREVLKYKNELRTQFEAIRTSVTEATEIVILPRYVRVNTLMTTLEECQNVLKRENFIFLGELKATTQFNKDFTYFNDHTIPNLLVFSRNATKYLQPIVEKGYLIFQDKASCIPAHILAPAKNSVIIDACAAPGNKTSFLASLLNKTGKIYAFDIDKHRLNEMKKNLKRWEATYVEAIRHDFLKVKPSDYTDVEYILVDPSCSGSGMANRVDQPIQDKSNELSMRLGKLQNFQVMALKHALSFPSVQKVVYSTCSIYQEENEMVVKEALESYAESFNLEFILPEWESRGKNESFEYGHYCLRASPENDRTIGFFVALFKRKNIQKI